jgi:putative two-component system response regulator
MPLFHWKGVFMNSPNEDLIVARLSEITALEYGLHPAVAKRLYAAAVTHDIGKKKIPVEILQKPGNLTKQEFEIVKTHTTIGAEMLAVIKGELGRMARLIAKYHHEWYDGSESYWGRYSCDLPAFVSIVSLCDVFVALLSERPYKNAWPPKEAMSFLKSQAGTQFNPALVEVFLSVARNGAVLTEVISGTRRAV